MFHDDLKDDVLTIAAVCLVLVIVATALFVGLSGTPEPQWWIELENAGKSALQ